MLLLEHISLYFRLLQLSPNRIQLQKRRFRSYIPAGEWQPCVGFFIAFLRVNDGTLGSIFKLIFHPSLFRHIIMILFRLYYTADASQHSVDSVVRVRNFRDIMSCILIQKHDILIAKLCKAESSCLAFQRFIIWISVRKWIFRVRVFELFLIL
jgi:hypothetical protein